MNLHQFRFVQEAVRRGLNLTETAKALYTSQPGILENMQYEQVPTAYHGCVPVSQMKKPVYWE